MIFNRFFKRICFALILTINMGNLVFAEEIIDATHKQEAVKHFFDLGIGLGLDYGGIIGAKLSYILPFPYISIFGAAGAQLLGFGWSVGTTFHILPETNKYVFRPNLKIMYGINRSTKVVGKSMYDKMFTGWTPGIGLEFMFGKMKANGFDIDLNYPIGSTKFNDQMDKINDDPQVGEVTMLPVAFSFGYHHEF
jgi:hypothetical protein